MKSDKKSRGKQDKGIMSPAIVGWYPQPKLLIAFLTGMNKLCFSFKSVITGCTSLYVHLVEDSPYNKIIRFFSEDNH
jgi:hypothetical protein